MTNPMIFSGFFIPDSISHNSFGRQKPDGFRRQWTGAKAGFAEGKPGYIAPTVSATATVFRHDLEDEVIDKLASETIDGKRHRMTHPRNVRYDRVFGLSLRWRR